jgi:fatty acid-binding protein DegV
MSEDLFRKIIGNEKSHIESKGPDTASAKMDALNQMQKLQQKQLLGHLSINDVRQLTQNILSKNLPEYNNIMVSMLLNLKNSVLDAVVLDLINILQVELNGDLGIDVSFLVQLMERLDVLSKDGMTPEIRSAFHRILSEQIPGTNDLLDLKIQHILQGRHHVEASVGTDYSMPQSSPTDPLDLPKSANLDVLGASNQIQMSGMDGLDNIVFEKNSLTNSDQSIKIESSQNAMNADIVIQKNENSMGFIKAFGRLNNRNSHKDLGIFISAIIQISNLKPIFVISPVVSQMLVELGRMVDEKNLFKVAIVTDNVASLQDVGSLDYVRKVNAKDQSQYGVYEEYKRLYEDGYHYIISLHLNPNLKKTYNAALAAKKYIDEQKIKDLEINVYNTSANGVGLGLMIYELVDAIKNNYSPLEVNKLARQLVDNYRHWLCPLEFDFVKNHQWVMKYADNQKKVQMRLFHFIPVIELDKKLTIVSVSYTQETAFLSLIAAMERSIQLKNRKINRICVEYRGVYREALKIKNQIKVKFPSAKVSLQTVGSITTKFFGPELVGICII